MSREQLISLIREKENFLCVGLDTDLDKIPKFFLEKENPIFEFNKAIIDATKDYCVAYKPNLAFYECHGPKGWEAFQKTVEYITDSHFIIADAKRGDIGNTSKYYARSFFENTHCDAVTVAPYMGHDSVTPFFEFRNRWVILLALTSNEGALDFQFLKMHVSHQTLWQKVVSRAQTWGSPENMMFVVGATRAETMKEMRELTPRHFYLVPGIGAQGGSLNDVMENGMTDDCGLLVNASRSVIYAGEGDDFADKAREAARAIQIRMAKGLRQKGII